MVDTKEKKECSGCTACFEICPTKAITMSEDKLGFLYPMIDVDKCIKCGLCDSICSFRKPKHSVGYPLIYAMRYKDLEKVSQSQSGGAFSVIAEYVLTRGGVVYGAGFRNYNYVQHQRIDSLKKLYKLKKSKYVQSDIRNIFPKVKKDLSLGTQVLFSGTPCQVAGVLSYLKCQQVNTDNLITVDLICHGVPSPKVWRDYIKYIEARVKKTIVDVEFRDKKHYGWKAHKETFYTTRAFYTTDTYTYIFYNHVMFKESCYTCPFAVVDRLGDISLGDFWGEGNKQVQELKADDLGLSCVFVNSHKGKKMLDSIKADVICIPAKIEEAMQPQLQYPAMGDHFKRKEFEEDYYNHGFKYIKKKYGPSLRERLKKRTNKIVKNIIITFFGKNVWKIAVKIIKCVRRP